MAGRSCRGRYVREEGGNEGGREGGIGRKRESPVCLRIVRFLQLTFFHLYLPPFLFLG